MKTLLNIDSGLLARMYLANAIGLLLLLAILFIIIRAALRLSRKH